MRGFIITFILFSISCNFLNAQGNNQLIVEGLSIKTSCQGGNSTISFSQNQFHVICSYHHIIPKDTIVILSDKELVLLNRAIKKLIKIKPKNSVRKTKHSCPCYQKIVLLDGKSRDIAMFLKTKAPIKFKRIIRLANKFEEKYIPTVYRQDIIRNKK